MTPQALTAAVAQLYTAAGRHYGEVELETYARTLADIPDDVGAQAVAEVIAGVDLGQRAPSPHLVLASCQAVRRRQALKQPSIPESTGPVTAKADALDRIRAIRSELRGAK